MERTPAPPSTPSEGTSHAECPYVTGTVTRYCTLTPFTLTDEEREAIEWAVHWITSSTPNGFCPPALRELLKRIDAR